MTIYALSSGPGLSGLAVIRISGDQCMKVLKEIAKISNPLPRTATLTKFYKQESNEVIDEGIIIWFPSPKSYTGEDVLEFHVHGSRAVINSILETLSKINGCRIAEPGEFTKIALENGKINLLKAESIGDLIAAETEIQRRQAIDIMSGNHGKKYANWREKLIKILSNIEAKIDFPEEELPKNILEDIKKNSSNVKNEIIKTLDDQMLPEGDVTIAIKYSTLNYKDGMIIKGLGNMVREYPHIPGIDFSGVVEDSTCENYRPGDNVILTGWGVGETHWGGFSERARVKSEWLVPLPSGLSLKQAMSIGTAGFSAMLAIMIMEDLGLKTDVNYPILVTGAAGGVGSIAIAILANLGYQVAAGTAILFSRGHIYHTIS